MDDDEFFRWYGPWQPLDPPEVAELFDGIAVPWWIVGGWSIQAFTGVEREHEDTDVAILTRDLPGLLDHLLPHYCVWSNHAGTLRPLRTPDQLLPGCEQLWLRRDGASPWLLDLLLTPHDGEDWISKRDERIRVPLTDALFEPGDGIRYLRPEITLHMKAKLARPKDDDDLTNAVPLLDPAARSWLRTALELANPEHPWLERLQRMG